LLLGSVAARVARTATVPVMIVSASASEHRASACQKTFLSPAGLGPAQTILVAIDFEAASLTAVPFAFELAEALSARVHLLHVYAPVVLPGPDGSGNIPFEPLYHRAIARVREVAKPYVNSERLGRCFATMGNPSLTILDTATELAADVIVVGTHGRTGLQHLLLGSVAEKVIREARCPVVVTKCSLQASVHNHGPQSTVRSASVP
ncbi:MAG: hypothetical protein JWN04_3856, partial [Myxococcaceae bacterium]|nr:hypothetical protein [Myxococcaceae bacterium]